MRAATRGGMKGLVCLAVLGALVPGLALADARVEARRHFKKGMALISAGRPREGVAELKEAYAIRPHPNVLFNIAKASEAAELWEEALTHYRRYLAFDPPDARNVAERVAVLEAKVAPPPPRAPSPDPPPSTKPAVPTVPAVDAESMKRLEELALRLESAVERAERLSSSPSEPEPPPGAELLAEASGDVVGEAYEETVVTASRRAQSTKEAPNATTVITAEEIRLSGARTLPELLRRVPGAEVMTLGVGSANLSIRGFNQRVANKVLVLLDGRSEYQDFVGLTVWPAIPVSLEEIDRIEIIRGPGSALYGANAMLGVVNIITRAPGSDPKAEFNLGAGTGSTAAGSFIASGGKDRLKFRASVGYEQADKWTRDYADDRADVYGTAQDSSLGLRVARGNLTTHYAHSRSASASAAAGFARLFTEFYPPGLLRNFHLDGVTAYGKTDVAVGPLRLKGFWNHLSAQAGLQYAAHGERTMGMRIESNVFDAEALAGHEVRLGGTHRFDVGASLRVKRLDWDFMPALKSELHVAAFLQDEWRIAEPLRLLASYRVDRHPLLDRGSPGYAQSPRVSVVWAPLEGHALRAGAATAFREPTFLESYTTVTVGLPSIPGGAALTTGNLALRAEQLVSYELGYHGEDARLGMDWDVAVYQYDVTNLVTISALSPLPPEQAYDERSGVFLLGRSQFVNEPATYTARGVELGVKMSPIDRLDLRASGALQNVTTATAGPCAPCRQAPSIKVFGSVAYRSRLDVDLSVDAAWTSSTVWIEREPLPSDPTQIAALENPLAAYTVVNARAAYHLLGERLTLAVMGTNLAAAHQQHPFGNLIERRLFATLTVKP